MGDYIGLIAFREVDDVPKVLAAAEASLRDLGVVAGAYDPDAMLAPRTSRALRPAPDVAAIVGHPESLLSLRSNGVAFNGPGFFHDYGLGLSTWFECPMCIGRITEDHDRFGDQMNALGMAAMHWATGEGETAVTCGLCHVASNVTQWRIADPVFMADVVVEFCNWPALDPDNRADGTWWKLDIITPLEWDVGRPALVSGYKI